MKYKQKFDTILQEMEMIVMSNLQAEEYKSFEAIKKIRKNGTEYWNARELGEVLLWAVKN